MPSQRTFYQRLFHIDSFSSPINQQARSIVMRRHCSDRLCLSMSLLLLTYTGWHVLSRTNYTWQKLTDPTEELAYKNALTKSIPIIENTQICSLDAVDLSFVIISSSSHFLERQSIRETWASMPDLFGIHSQRLFVVGYHAGANLYKDIVNEAKHEQDVLYLTVDDHSVTLKELHAYRWLEKHCASVVYTFKTEDDLFVNSLLLHELIRELKNKPNEVKNRQLYGLSLDALFQARQASDSNQFLYGWAYLPAAPERNNTMSPFYVSYEEYSKEVYPNYCSGFGYLMDSKTRNALTSEGLKEKNPFRFADIYVSGIIPERLKFTCQPFSFTFLQGSTDECIELIQKNNKKEPTPSSPPVIICSTGRHTGQHSFSDYGRLWTALKQTYADRLHSKN